MLPPRLAINSSNYATEVGSLRRAPSMSLPDKLLLDPLDKYEQHSASPLT